MPAGEFSPAALAGRKTMAQDAAMKVREQTTQDIELQQHIDSAVDIMAKIDKTQRFMADCSERGIPTDTLYKSPAYWSLVREHGAQLADIMRSSDERAAAAPFVEMFTALPDFIGGRILSTSFHPVSSTLAIATKHCSAMRKRAPVDSMLSYEKRGYETKALR